MDRLQRRDCRVQEHLLYRLGRRRSGQDQAIVATLCVPGSCSPGLGPLLTIAPIDFQNTQGIIFVIDSNDRERVSEAREELQRMLNEDELRDALLLVFANKQDLPNARASAFARLSLG